MVSFAIGEDTGGSIRNPSSWCNITGLKVTYGRVSRYGAIAYASSFDSVGPMAKTAQDCAIILETIAGHDHYDATSSPQSVPPYSQILDKSISGVTVGIPTEFYGDGLDSEIKSTILKMSQDFEKIGIKTKEISMPLFDLCIPVYYLVGPSETSANLARYDGIRYGNDRTNFTDETIRRILIGTYALSAGYYDAYYKKAEAVRTKMIDQFAEIFNTYDAIIGAVSPGPALLVGATKNQPMFGEMEDILLEQSSIAGLTGASVPCGFLDSLPIGLQITCNQFQENKAFQIADCYQRNTNFNLYPDLEKTL